jgi:thioredoxin-like negative regulator of GroEL
MEKIDLPQSYLEIDEELQKEDPDDKKILQIAEKILRADAKEKEAQQCKITALINLSKSDDLIAFLDKSNLTKDYLLEYAYALYLKKSYQESIDFLNKTASQKKELTADIRKLLAQNFYKMGNYESSYKIYNEIFEEKQKNKSDFEEERDLVSNFLGAFVMSHKKDESVLKSITKHLESWESFYNYCLICLNQGNLNEAIETMFRIKRDFSDNLTDDASMKVKNLNLLLFQSSFDGFDYSKISNVNEEYESFFTKGKYQDLYPYFFNNYHHSKKEKESLNEIIKKYETLLKNEELSAQEKQTLQINRIVLLLRLNKFQEAQEIFKTLPQDFNDVIYLIIYCYLHYKLDKLEKLEELAKTDKQISDKPETHLIIIQLILSSLSAKNVEQFHVKVLNFIQKFFSFTLNFNFLNFFIGFYESRHLKELLKEFLRNYKDLNLITKTHEKDSNLKKCINLLGRSFYSVGLYDESAKFFYFILDNIDKYDKDAKLSLINSLSHTDIAKSEETRKQVDETLLDLSTEHINNLLNEVFLKFKKNPADKTKKKSKKKKIIRYPKGFDPKKPGPLPDPERWLPKLQRKKFRNIAKNKMAYQGAQTDNTTTTTQFKK